jgi:hypothetical protein
VFVVHRVLENQPSVPSRSAVAVGSFNGAQSPCQSRALPPDRNPVICMQRHPRVSAALRRGYARKRLS